VKIKVILDKGARESILKRCLSEQNWLIKKEKDIPGRENGKWKDPQPFWVFEDKQEADVAGKKYS
jgi:hypothetical protein